MRVTLNPESNKKVKTSVADVLEKAGLLCWTLKKRKRFVWKRPLNSGKYTKRV